MWKRLYHYVTLGATRRQKDREAESDEEDEADAGEEVCSVQSSVLNLNIADSDRRRSKWTKPYERGGEWVGLDQLLNGRAACVLSS